jgi:hypothetical protein
MTHEQFNEIRWVKGMRCTHTSGDSGHIVGVNFNEYLLEVSFDDSLGFDWVRCENVELINKQP